MIFGSTRDSRTLLHIRREFVQDVIEQEILYWKVDLASTTDNVYGEAVTRGYWNPVRVTCLIERGDLDWTVDEFGPDLNRVTEFAFIKEDLVDLGLKVESGDIIEWNKNYFEVDSWNENQFFIGRDEHYRLSDGTLGTEDETGLYGQSVSIVAKTHLTRNTKLSITK